MKIVLGHGNPKAKVMLIGEAPGAQEVKHGKPFVGPAGKWLDKILKKNKINREKLYITNVVKVKTPDNRRPTEKEIKQWLPILISEIKKVKPKIIVLLGESASMAVLGKKVKERGKIIPKGKIKYLITYHPSAARFTKIRKTIEEDIRKVRNPK